jgi:hypothetical protein
MPLDRTPDAVCYPHGMILGRKTGDMLLATKLTWGPVLKSPRVNILSDPVGYNFAVPLHKKDEGQPVPTRFFPYGHPLEKQERYTCYVAQPDGAGGWSLGDLCDGVDDRVEEVRFGYLVDAAKAVDPEAERRVNEALAARAADKHQAMVRLLSDDPATRARYQAGLGLTDEQMDARYPRLEPRPDAAPGRTDPDDAGPA